MIDPLTAVLVYALIHRKDMFSRYSDHPSFGSLVAPIAEVASFFQDKLSGLYANDGYGMSQPSTVQVLEAIDQASKSWSFGSSNHIAASSKLDFEFKHDAGEEEGFFQVMLWSLVYRYSIIYWGENAADLWEI